MNTLDAISRDDVDPEEADALLQQAIDRGATPSAIYTAVAQWTWSALTGRRFDDGLRPWHRTMQKIAARLERGERRSNARNYAERVEALGDLLKASIHISEEMQRGDVLRRAHVMDVLHFLSDRADGPVGRTDIENALGLRSANLSRILTMMVNGGLVERLPEGRSVSFKILPAGIKAAIGNVETETSELSRRLTGACKERERVEHSLSEVSRAIIEMNESVDRQREAASQIAKAAVADVIARIKVPSRSQSRTYLFSKCTSRLNSDVLEADSYALAVDDINSPAHRAQLLRPLGGQEVRSKHYEYDTDCVRILEVGPDKRYTAAWPASESAGETTMLLRSRQSDGMKGNAVKRPTTANN